MAVAGDASFALRFATRFVRAPEPPRWAAFRLNFKQDGRYSDGGPVILLLGVLILLLTACTPTVIRPSSGTDLFTPAASSTMVPTTPLTIINPSPSSTLSPSLTAIPTQPLITVTPLPTLSPGDEETFLLDLIASNKACELPCWWGIMPGSAMPHDLLGFLNPLGIDDIGPPRPWTDGNNYYHYPFEVNQVGSLNLTVTFSEKDGIVQSVSVTAFNFRAFPKFAAAFQSFALSELLLRHGTPSRVLVGLQPPVEPNADFTYDVWLFYDQSGLLIEYFGKGVIPTGNHLEVCPTHDSVLEMHLYLQSPSSVLPLDKLTLGYADFDALIARGYLRPLEDATNLGLSDFQNMIAHQPEACFQSPAEIW